MNAATPHTSLSPAEAERVLRRARTARRGERSSALKLLEAHLESKDNASWYEARLELVGIALFGDLWKLRESKAARENRDL